MRSLVLACSALAMAACSPPAQQAESPDVAPPTVEACNEVSPNMAHMVRVEDAAAVAAAASDLRGGRIAPGLYDLTSAARIGAATGWSGARAVSLSVSEGEDGAVTFNWAGAGDGDVDRWTAAFTETPEPRLTFTCGRIGDAPVSFNASAAELRLRVQDGAGGALYLVFQPRAG